MGVKIAVIGGANVDMVAAAPRLPKPGETVIGTNFTIACGGKGANQAVAAARLGASVSFIGRVGDDMFGEMLERSLCEAGVDTTFLKRDSSSHTGVAQIYVAQGGENCIIVVLGANGRVSAQDVEGAEERIRCSDCLVLQLEVPEEAVTKALEIANRCGVRVVFNSAPAQDFALRLLSMCDVVTLNESEAMQMTGFAIGDLNDAMKAAIALREMGTKAVVLTIGEQGAIIADENDVEHIPAFKVNSIDATAAGDAFTAALAVKLCEGASLREAVLFANAAGALATTKLGAQPSLPYRSEVEGLISGAQR
ncbi:MAG: ribokinase [Armatimonadota bacterium]|nr:ribokinase [Armatimonadota bacterium]MCX7776655.1 ribokinase [Armatimonadota bacterium]MDW8025730.1 ribokinase [Armatimonadota bacterium]